MSKTLVSLMIVISLLLSGVSCYANGTADTSVLITLSEELSEGEITRFNISSKKDELLNIVVTAKNMSDFAEKRFVLSYQSDGLIIENLFKYSNASDYVTILKNTPGKVEFTVSNNLVKSKKYSGTINIFEFRCKKENTIIELYEKNSITVDDVTIDAAYTNEQLTICGEGDSVESLNITVMTENNLSVMSDTVSLNNGQYSKTFDLPEYFSNGKYCVKVEGANLVTKYHYFDYTKEKDNVFSNTENVILDAKRNINNIKITGKYTGMYNVPLPVAFYDSQNKLIDFRQINLDDNNKFEYDINIGDDWQEGRYNVVASGKYVNNPTKYSFYIYHTPSYDINGDVTANKNEMRIVGSIGSGKHMITACIQNKFNEIVHFEQFQSDENGEFDKTFLIKKYLPNGTYKLVLSGEKTLAPVTTEFEYNFNEFYMYPEISVDASFISDTSANISVNVVSQFNDRILIVVKDDNGNLIYAKQIHYQTKVNSYGEDVNFTVNNISSENLNITVSGYYLSPQTLSVENPIYNSDSVLENNDILEENNNEENE